MEDGYRELHINTGGERHRRGACGERGVQKTISKPRFWRISGEKGSSKNLTKSSQLGPAAQAMLRSGESPGFLSQNTWFRVPHLLLCSQGIWGTSSQLSVLQSTHLQNLEVYMSFVKCKCIPRGRGARRPDSEPKRGGFGASNYKFDVGQVS